MTCAINPSSCLYAPTKRVPIDGRFHWASGFFLDDLVIRCLRAKVWGCQVRRRQYCYLRQTGRSHNSRGFEVVRHRLCRGVEYPALPIVRHNQMSTPENAVAWSRTLTLVSDDISLHQISDESNHQSRIRTMIRLGKLCCSPPHLFFITCMPFTYASYCLPFYLFYLLNILCFWKADFPSSKGFSYNSLNHTTSGSGLTNTRYVFRRAHRGDPGPEA